MNEVVHKHDYELAHLLQEAFYLKQREVRNFKGIFDPVDLNIIPFRFPDKFIVNNKATGRALQYILGDLMNTKVKGIQMVFEKDFPEQGGKSSVNRSNDETMSLTLQNHISASDGIFSYEDFQLAYLHQIGWQTEDLEKQRFSLSIRKHSEDYQEQIRQALARTYYELIPNRCEETNCFVHINHLNIH